MRLLFVFSTEFLMTSHQGSSNLCHCRCIVVAQSTLVCFSLKMCKSKLITVSKSLRKTRPVYYSLMGTTYYKPAFKIILQPIDVELSLNYKISKLWPKIKFKIFMSAPFLPSIAHNAPFIIAMPTLKWLINWYLKPAHRILLTNCIAAKAQNVTVHDGLKKTNNS